MALSGTLVLDLTRMLPGAVLARMLLDLGARVIKVEDPALGDPLRSAPPLVGGTGAGFAYYYRGAESLDLDLRSPEAPATLLPLARHADVLVESFRPGTLEAWGLGHARLLQANPALVVCAVSGFGQKGPCAKRIGHDLNFEAESGLLSLLPGCAMPATPLADITGGLLACSAVLAALLSRARTGRGLVVDQPLSASALPLLSWAAAETAAGEGGLGKTLLSGSFPSYRRYRCADGNEIAFCTLEPKFWESFLELTGLERFKSAAVDPGGLGREASEALAERIAREPRDHWTRLGAEKGLPISAVNTLEEALSGEGSCLAPYLRFAPPGTSPRLGLPGPFLPSLASAEKESGVPALGEHAAGIRREFGLE
jgi:alpha-methylacyl-CoA racemase